MRARLSGVEDGGVELSDAGQGRVRARAGRRLLANTAEMLAQSVTVRETPIRIRVERVLFDLILCFVAFSVIPVLIYRFVNPPTTALMWIRWAESGYSDEVARGILYWKPLQSISPHLVKAVIAAEDQKFFSHHGFD